MARFDAGGGRTTTGITGTTAIVIDRGGVGTGAGGTSARDTIITLHLALPNAGPVFCQPSGSPSNRAYKWPRTPDWTGPAMLSVTRGQPLRQPFGAKLPLPAFVAERLLGGPAAIRATQA